MDDRFLISLFILLALLMSSTTATPPAGKTWVSTFEDNFDGIALDTMKWHPHDHFCGVRNSELQAYEPENITLSGGSCLEKGEVRQCNYGYCGQPGTVKQYASGMMVTMGKFDQKYGYFEIRCKIPKGKGYWPAFWLLPYNKWPPEIDILEILGDNPFKVYMTNHWGTSAAHQSKGGNYTGPDFSAGYHEFGAAWDSLRITWYVDGIQRFQSDSGIPHEPFFILANLAIGGSWPGAPDTNTVFPQNFDIDWIRVWQDQAYLKSDGPSRLPAGIPAELTVTPLPSNGNVGLFFRISGSPACNAGLEIFSPRGERVFSFRDLNAQSMNGRVVWNGKFQDGKSAPSGLYLARLSSGAILLERRILLVR